MIEGLASLFFLALLVEGIVKAFTDTVTLPAQYAKLIKRLSSIAVGLALAFGFALDYSSLIGITAISPTVGYIFTGVLAGLGSNILHDILDKYSR